MKDKIRKELDWKIQLKRYNELKEKYKTISDEYFTMVIAGKYVLIPKPKRNER